ncbi:VOC family protein [Terrimonas rubra]|uniref:VOC family protein n=1 Tax=Terrimonas rubra TaxID=1035890 RepID=A0ABW6A831_9BACT
MMKAILRLKTNSIKDSELFYCKDLELFDFYQDYGMGSIALMAKNNPGFMLLLTTGTVPFTEEYLFELQTDNCDALFDTLKGKAFTTPGRLLSTTVFEYPLGKSIALEDPSGNKFLLFEE